MLNLKYFLVLGVVLIAAILGINKISIPSSKNDIERSGFTLSFQPGLGSFKFNETKDVKLIATFSNRPNGERLDGFRTEIDFPNTYFNIPPSQLINVSTSGFDTALRVETPQYANQTGKIIIELVHLYKDPNKPPPATDQPITIARIPLKAIKQSTIPQTIFINKSKTQLVNDKSKEVLINDLNKAVYSIK